MNKILASFVLSVLAMAFVPLATSAESARQAVPRQHPYLLGSVEELKALAKARQAEYQRMGSVARGTSQDKHGRIISGALVAAIENDKVLAKTVQQLAMEFINAPIRKGHETFAHDLALCAIAYDLCQGAWSEEDRRKLLAYINATVDANVQSETHVFHNGWYGYKNWGTGLAGYATFYENERSPAILKTLEEDYRTRTVPALELAGEGGGWAEGYYIHYFLYEWLFFCEVARRCEGVDYYALAPKFYRQRAIASMFEAFPGIGQYNTRRSVPMGDGGGRVFGGDRDKELSARRILVSYFRNDPEHQTVHAFNETTPRSGSGTYAYKDFLWHDTSVPKGDVKSFRLSHFSPGPGFVYARSSWDEDATYFFFKCGDRFTAHQHLDLGHFNIYMHEELAGDGGHYDGFGTLHDVNYHLRTIAHSTMLVLDPEERWPGIRAGKVTGNDGGQTHSWRHHNGAASDVADWQKQKAAMDIADLLAFEEHGDYLYVAGDATRAYSSNKLEMFTRQIVFLRPGTFVIFDRVKAKRPEFKKSWLLQAMHAPTKSGRQLVITNGKGRLFVQTLLPQAPEVRLVSGEDLYSYGGQAYPPKRKIGAAPECRIEVSPKQAQVQDLFLHVLTAANSEVDSAPAAEATLDGGRVQVKVGAATVSFPVEDSPKCEVRLTK